MILKFDRVQVLQKKLSIKHLPLLQPANSKCYLSFDFKLANEHRTEVQVHF